MEVCGGQTHSIVRYGLDRLLPSDITLIHGPGCPVCVTPIELIDAAIQLAGHSDTHLMFIRRYVACARIAQRSLGCESAGR